MLPYNTCCVACVLLYSDCITHTADKCIFLYIYSIYWRVLSIGELLLAGCDSRCIESRKRLLTFVDSSGPNRCSEIVLCARSCVSCALAAAQTVVLRLLRPTCSSTAI